MAKDDDFWIKAIEGLVLFAFNQGEFVLVLQEPLFKRVSMMNLWKNV